MREVRHTVARSKSNTIELIQSKRACSTTSQKLDTNQSVFVFILPSAWKTTYQEAVGGVWGESHSQVGVPQVLGDVLESNFTCTVSTAHLRLYG